MPTNLDVFLAELSIADRNFYLDSLAAWGAVGDTEPGDSDTADYEPRDDYADDAWQTGQDRYEATFAQ
jgi:hypothetical protein